MPKPMKKTPISFAVLVTLILGASDLTGQVIEQPESQISLFRSSVLAKDSAAFDTPTWRSRIFTGLGAAVLGAGVGFFVSQLTTSDWEEGGGKGSVHRSTWAAVGGAGGFVLGFSMPIRGQAPGGPIRSPSVPDRFIITGEEIEKASVRNALEAVRLLHPEWLVTRGQEAFNDPGSDDIRAYVDNLLLGGVENLVELDAPLIRSIRFYDAREATARWGSGHTHGAIHVLTLH